MIIYDIIYIMSIKCDKKINNIKIIQILIKKSKKNYIKIYKILLKILQNVVKLLKIFIFVYGKQHIYKLMIYAWFCCDI